MTREASVTTSEMHVMKHSLGWPKRYRNHFCASEGHDDWATIQGLVERGLMRVGRYPGPLSGGDTVFIVTADGIAALEAYELA